MRFAARTAQMKASAIRELFDKARHVPGAIDLSIGQADFDVPDEIKEATARMLKGPCCGRYSPTEGHAEAVEATAEHLRERFGLPREERVMLTAGASGALTLAILALVDPGDEVLLPDPYFVIYRNLVHVAGGEPAYYDLYPDFRLRAEEVVRRITPRTRLVVLNSPANPTGGAASREELREVCRACGERGIPLVSDELYALFSYDVPHVSVKEFPGAESLLVGGFSKTYGMAGWRLGWAAGPAELVDRMRILQQFTYTCPPTLAQGGALAAFDVDMGRQVAAYRAKRDAMLEGLRAAGYRVETPAGAFFLFPEVPWGDDVSFCARALEEKLILVPGSAFSRRSTHFRMSFAAPDHTLERALAVLARIATG